MIKTFKLYLILESNLWLLLQNIYKLLVCFVQCVKLFRPLLYPIIMLLELDQFVSCYILIIQLFFTLMDIWCIRYLVIIKILFECVLLVC